VPLAQRGFPTKINVASSPGMEPEQWRMAAGVFFHFELPSVVEPSSSWHQLAFPASPMTFLAT